MSCPYPLDSLHGNSVSARRLEGVLQEAGLAVDIQFGWDGAKGEVLIALHAVRSAEVVRRFKSEYPKGKVVLVLTGTDLYRDLLKEDSPGFEALEAADRLVVAQDQSKKSVPELYLGKTQVIRKSVELPQLEQSEGEEPSTFSVVGHMRGIKDPFLAVEALAERRDWAVKIWQLGGERQEGYGALARDWERQDTRFEWLGELSRIETLRRVRRSRAIVNSSRMEGGSNAVLEAMVLGVPVLATRIEGNVGLLGEDYEGYFEVGNRESFLELLARFLENPAFEAKLRERVKERASLFNREQEVLGWKRLLEQL